MSSGAGSVADAEALIDERRRYLACGYVVVAQVVPDPFLADVRNQLEVLVEQRISDWRAASQLEGEHLPSAFGLRYHEAWRAAGCPPHPTLPYEGQLLSTAFGELAGQRWLVDLVRAVLGSAQARPIAASCFGRAKFPGYDGSNLPWHQDAPCIEPIAGVDFVTAWIPLADVPEHNPGLEIAPIGPDQPRFEIDWSGPGYLFMQDADVARLADVRPVSLDRGDLVLLSPLLPHRSVTNADTAIRWSVDLRFALR